MYSEMNKDRYEALKALDFLKGSKCCRNCSHLEADGRYQERCELHPEVMYFWDEHEPEEFVCDDWKGHGE